MRHSLVALVFCLAVATAAAAESKKFAVTVSAGKVDRINTPVKLALSVPIAALESGTATIHGAGDPLPGQLTRPGLLATPAQAKEGETPAELHFILPKLEAGKSLTLQVELSAGSAGDQIFAWKDEANQYSELSFAGRPVLRYMHTPLDESSKEARMATYKPYHHVYDPTGKFFVTKGPGGLFPHHRGLYYGFNRITYADGKKKADTWHCNNGEFQSHEGATASEAGPVLGRHTVKIDWHGQDGAVFARELREMTAYNTAGGTLIEFASKLSSEVGPVKLDGDPQHAGFQFRATQQVPDKTAKQTYYLRPDGKGTPGKFRNWPQDKTHVNLPWNALSFVVGDQRYTCCYLDRPQNPKEARFSERDYGRFGSYFEHQLDTGKPLELNYRIWLQTGEMDVAGVQQLDDTFVNPVEVAVK